MTFLAKAAGGLLLSFGPLLVSGQQEPPSVVGDSAAALTNSALRQVEPGVFAVGQVTLDQRRRCVTFPATLNKSQGLMEYFLVTTYGKTHESVLKTAAEPFHLHLAMLLLGAVGSGKADFPGAPTNGVPGPIIHPSKEAIPGDKVSITVKWKTAQGERRFSAEDLVFNNDSQAVMAHGAWVYNGSLMVRNKFLAQMDGSLISLVTDPVALINNTGPGHDNDMIWIPNTNNLPPADVPVEVTVSLEGAQAK
ncbi:MAG: YdjY domain-containing protein [Limisphaerales bacterium]